MTLIRVLGVFGVVLLGLLILGAYEDSVRWEKYRVEHHCRMTKSATVWMPLMTGKTLTYTPVNKTTWMCDDDVVIER